MSSEFAVGKSALGDCDICGFTYKLHQLKELTIATKPTNLLACPTCWNEDHPQLLLGMYSSLFIDPQSLRNPRPQNDEIGSDIQWGWNPVGYTDPVGEIQSTLEAVGHVGTVTVTTS